MVYPGFPTDLQAPMMAVACKTPGTSVFLETIFENRFMHAAELSRLGAHIRVENRVAVVEGTPDLTGAPVTATDLRAGAALILASGELSRHICEGAERAGGRAVWFDSRDALIRALPDWVRDGDAVLVKASHSMAFEEITKALTAE